MRPLTPKRILAICAMLAAILFVVVVISLRVGAYPISMRDIVVTLYNGAVGNGDSSDFSQVIFGLRLPRIALGILVGAALSTSGAGFQALLRNPLADPFVLGVSSGAALGASEQGAKLVAESQERLDALHTTLQDRPMAHVLFVVWEDPLITIGQNTFIADALRWAGAESVIISKQDWPQISMEEVLRLEPDYIVLTSNHAGTDDSDQVRDLRSRGVWNQIEAVKLGRIVVVGEEVTRPAPGLVEVVVELAHGLHPEVFGVDQKHSRLENLMWESDAGRLVACVH